MCRSHAAEAGSAALIGLRAASRTATKAAELWRNAREDMSVILQHYNRADTGRTRHGWERDDVRLICDGLAS